MKAMILAAGGATRLYPLTYTLPKPLVPVLNVPVIEHLIALLHRHSFDEIVINVHYLHRTITEALGDGHRFGVKLHYSHEEELLGTAGGVRRVADFFDDTFLVVGGDDLTDLDLSALLKFHREKQALATLAVSPLGPTPSAHDVGVLELDDEHRVTWFLEKPDPKRGEAGRWSNSGIYMFEPKALEWIPAKGSYDMGLQLFPEMVRRRAALYGYPMGSAFWCDVGSHLRYRQAHFDLLVGKTRIFIPGKEIRPHIWVEEGADISPQAYLRPPLLIGKGCRIEAQAELTGPVVLGAGSVVCSGAKVRSSVLWEQAWVGGHALVEDCLVGSGCTLQDHQRYSKVVLASGARAGGVGRESTD